jgi:hypothetical protein
MLSHQATKEFSFTDSDLCAITLIRKHLRNKKLYDDNLVLMIAQSCLYRNQSLDDSASDGKLEVVKYLIKTGNYTVDDKNLALFYAAGNGSLEVVKYLIEECGADIHTNYEEITDVLDGDYGLLGKASRNGHIKVVEYLIKSKAYVHADYGMPLCLASRGGHLKVVECLINSGANIHASGNLALCWASTVDVVKYLMKCGMDIDAEYAICAAYDGHLEVVKYYVEECGFDIRTSDDMILSAAAGCGHLEIVKYFIARNPNIEDSVLRSVAEGVVECGQLEVMKYLVDNGVDLPADDNWAWGLAEDNGHTHIFQYADHYFNQ